MPGWGNGRASAAGSPRGCGEAWVQGIRRMQGTGFATPGGMIRRMIPAALAMMAPVAPPRPAFAGSVLAGLAFSPEGWTPRGRPPLRRHSTALPVAPPPPRTPLARYVAQGAAMLAAMGFVFWVAALIS